MMLQSNQYQLPDEWDLDQLQAKLAETIHLAEAESSQVDRLYLDSFEWQLWQAGAEVIFEQTEQGGRLCWVERKSGEVQESISVQAPPGYPVELPPGRMRDRLSQTLLIRRLLPFVRIEQQVKTLRVLNEDEKTVVRLNLVSSRFASGDGKQSGSLDSRVVLLPVKGYTREFDSMHSELQALGMKPLSQSLFEAALAGIGRRPGDYSSKLNYHLDPEGRADATAKQILLSLLNTLEANVEGTKANLDSEFLHDLRVATRRSRSAMGQIKGVFDERDLEPFKQGFAWIGQVTGPSRDMDVYLLKFDDYRASLPEKIKPDLEPFRVFLQEHHAKAYARLVRKLNSPQFRKLMKDWRRWLEEPVPNVSFQPNGVRPIAELADRRIFKIYKRVLKGGKAIQPDSHPESLHDLRKDCKKLRYLMEFFQSLYPKPEIQRLIKLLKMLLDNLGDFQDLQVQAEKIESFGDEMLKEGAPARTLMAMGILVGDLLKRQEQIRQEFGETFNQFMDPDNAQLFQQLFGMK